MEEHTPNGAEFQAAICAPRGGDDASDAATKRRSRPHTYKAEKREERHRKKEEEKQKEQPAPNLRLTDCELNLKFEKVRN